MKKRLLSLIVWLLFISWFAMAWNIAQQDASSKTSQCKADQSININYYINTSYTRYPSDIFANTSDDSFISPSNSSVQIWRNGVIGWCSDWYRSSNVVKSTDIDWAVVLQNGDGCVFTKPSYLKVWNNATKVDAQIHYTIWYYEKWWRFSPTMTSRFYYKNTDTSPWKCYPNWNVVSDTSSCTPVKVHYRDNIKLHTWECINYRIFRCGDGLVNSPYGSSYKNWTFTEQCDPNDPTQAGWNNNEYTCNASCQLVISTPVGQPDLTIDKEQITTWTMEAWSTVAYKITVKNEGSWTATWVSIYDLLPEELQYMTSSISITPSSTYLFTTGTVHSRTYIKYYNITLAANWTAIVYLTWKVKDGYQFDTLKNCASVSWSNIPVEEDCEEVTPPTPPAPTTCTITLSSDTITLWEDVTLSYVISGSFYSSTHIYLTGQQLIQWRMPFTVNNAQWNLTIQGDRIANTGTYTFVLQWSSLNGSDFSCTGILNVVDNNTPPPPPHTWQADISIQKILASVWPFDVWDIIQYKIIVENHWDATAVVPIWDVMPEAVTYLTSSIMFVPDTPQHYTFSTGLYDGKFMFRYSNVSLAPWQKAIIYLKWVINDHYLDPVTYQTIDTALSRVDCMYNWTTQLMAWIESLMTTNCAFTYTDGSGDNWSGTIIQSCVEFPKPAMVKYQSVRDMEFTRDQLPVAKNEIITYKIEFWNQSGEKMDDVHLLDVMPACVEYISSKVYGISGYWFSTWLSSNWNVLVSYSWFVLWSWQYGYMIVTWKISDSPACQNTYVYRNDAYMFYSWWRIDSFVVAKRPDILLTKTWDGPHYNLWQPNAFFITVTNNSTGILYDVTLSEVDSWLTFSDCVNYIDWKWANFTKDPNALVWRYNSPLQPRQSINLIISWSIGSGVSCIRDYINTVVLTCRDGAWYDYTLDAKYPFDVTTGESAELEKTVDKDKVSAGAEVVYTIRYKNIWHVDRDTWYSLTDIWPADVLTYLWSNCNDTCSKTQSGANYIFTFNSVLHPWEEWTLILRWKVIRPRPNNERKRNRVILRYRTRYYSGTLDDDVSIEYEEDDNNCGNGILEWDEECDGWYDNRSPTNSGRFYIFDYLDFNRTRQAPSNIAWTWYYCTQTCKLDKTSSDDYSYNIPSCISVDTTISIMENEIFPFWRSLWQRDGIKLVNGWSSESCNNDSTSKKTIINKDTMKCTFSVYDGKNYNQAHSRWNSKALNTFTVPCYFNREHVLDTYFTPFDKKVCAFSWCVDFDNVAARQAWNMKRLLWTWWKWDTYGEYKLAFEKVEYQYCAEGGTWKSGALYDAICEVNFALTKPYLMQINTSWTPRATSSDFLDRFYDITWNRIQTDISDVIKVDKRSYYVTTDVQSQITQFKNKYEKLAVATTNTLGWWVYSMKKVPNQSIYFIKWNGTKTLPGNDSIFSKPFTIFVEWIDLVIDGSILTNGMIITSGSISFKDSNCTSWWQVVQWIFIAQWWFKSNNSTLNVNTDKQWCHRWNLHVKWVLIWSWIDNITRSKRSQLNSRFETEITYRATNDSRLKAERRNEIIRWASVLIEYNPDTWMKSIPWAEIFTETLDVYRK